MNTENEVPFFARFLEGQNFPNVKTHIKAGPTTLKYPSDADENPVTMKSPSDGDDDPGGGGDPGGPGNRN